MKRWTFAAAGAACCLTFLASNARALMIAPAPIPQRVATADMVIVGKVTGFADKAVTVARFPGDTEKAQYQIAIVKVTDGLYGAKDVKEIRVGFIPPPPPGPGPGVPPGGPIRIGPRRFPQVQLTLGQEACMFLTKHTEGDFYTAPMYFSVIDKKMADFGSSVDEVKKCATLLADPKAGLESKKADDRLLTAGLLLYRYRMPRGLDGGAPKTEPIDAAESKAILKVLAEADWAPKAGPGPIGLRGFQMGPQALFYQLGLTEKDGWKPPMDFNKFPAEAKKWLHDNAEKFRIERFVPPAKKEKKDKDD
jgi:hypothetical protein